MASASTLVVATAPPSTLHIDGNFFEIGSPDHSTTTVINSDEPIGINRDFEEEAYGPTATGEKGDPFEVRWTDNDPSDPKNWSRAYRWYITMAAGMLLLNALVMPYTCLQEMLS